MISKLVAILAVGAYTVSASCPDSCSGHGTCGSHDKCSCFARWGGPNCADRMCPWGLSWVASADGYDNTPAGGALNGKHAYTECSSQGSCNKDTGECECFPGYEGRGCRRTQCPNQCSGHGRCVYNDELGQSYGTVGYQEFDSQYWDAHKSRQCVCDAGYEGIDCSSRQCPRGDDPLTECVNGDSNTGESKDMTQKITFPTLGTDGVDVFTNGFFTLTYIDNYGGEWITHPIEVHDPLASGVCDNIVTALEELPNFAIPNVTAVFDGTNNACQVTFVDPANSGRQPLLRASNHTIKDHDQSNMQPRFASFVATASGVAKQIKVEEVVLSAGNEYKEHDQCSNRGSCDHSSGVCTCFAGYTGEACNIQTVFF